MADDSEFLSRLISFGLSEKEAQLYFHLLKYGPKPPSLLAKSLKTYREDVHRMLTGLIDKGMVNPSLDSPTVYAAVDLETALDSALKKHEAELREMEMKKQELQELSRQQLFRPSDEFSTYKILKSVKDSVAAISSLGSSMEEELLACCSKNMPILISLYGGFEALKEFIDRGGKVKVISDIPYPNIELAQLSLEMGIELRHIERYSGILFIVFDRKSVIHYINADIKRMSLDEPVSALWSDDPTYANYLASTFEVLWEQTIPAAQRIEELLKEGPHHA